MQSILRELADLNGDVAFDSEKAAFGYVKPNERLYVTEEVLALCQTGNKSQHVTDIKEHEMLEICFLNYHHLVQSGMSVRTAIRVAFLRTVWIRYGCLLQSNDDRATPINEVVVETGNVAYPFYSNDDSRKTGYSDDGKLLKLSSADVNDFGFIKEMNDMDHKNWSFVSTILWGVAAHIFRVRGHHYKVEYEDLYNRTWAGTTLILPDRECNWSDLCRVAIHPFGIKALERSASYFEQTAKLSSNLVLRRDSIPAGSALIGTTYAAMSMLKATPFWNSFEKCYADVINGLTEDYNTVKTAGINAHQNARLYGVNPIEVRKSNANVLVPILMGFIDATPTNSAIRGQRVMVKPAQANPLMTNIMREWVVAAIERMSTETSLEKALTGKLAQAIEGKRVVELT